MARLGAVRQLQLAALRSAQGAAWPAASCATEQLVPDAQQQQQPWQPWQQLRRHAQPHELLRRLASQAQPPAAPGGDAGPHHQLQPQQPSAAAAPPRAAGGEPHGATADGGAPRGAQQLLAAVGSAVNRLTGYEAIDHLKGSVGEADGRLQEAKRALQAAKAEYDRQLAAQSELHREVTALLQRKSSWVPADVARFTQLYAAEHETEAEVAAAKASYGRLADESERLQQRLVDLIRERYQQEQLWSDKIRRASTWWTWGLMGLHFASFVAVYAFLEPRKRAALQEAVAEMLRAHALELDGRLAGVLPAAGGGGGQGQGDKAQGAAQQHQPQQQQQQQQQPQPAAMGKAALEAAGGQTEVQQQQQLLLRQLAAVQQHLEHLQRALPAAAGTGATAGAGAGAGAAQGAAGGQRWHIPGSAWAASQLAAGGQSARALWKSSKAAAQQVLGRLGAAGAGHGWGHPAGGQESAGGGGGSGEEPAPQRQQSLAAEAPAGRAADEGSAPARGSGLAGLMSQWTSGGPMLEVTRPQLAGVAAGAGALGAGVALAAAAAVLGRGGGGGGAAAVGG